MVLMQMCHQCVVGIFAGLSKASQFFQRLPRDASERSSKTIPSIRIEADGVLERSKHGIAGFALHDGYHDGFFLALAGRLAL